MSAMDNLIEQLSITKVEDKVEKEVIQSNPAISNVQSVVKIDKIVSFAGRGLSLNTEDDAAEIVQAIQNCPGMTTLKLEGNTFGIPAAKAIAKVLESQQHFENALWKDMFTRRDKDEIPKALSFLSSGIMLAKAQLVVLDLSDNAFGPRGLIGIKDLLQSSSCFTLQELYLNNNGLGISGATMLSEAMCNCIENSRKNGRPLNLKVFVCGRNRLENEGAMAVSKFLKQIGTLESVAMPQNGIYAPGITQLAEAFSCNPNLKEVNLNDNSLTEEGAERIADCLPSLKELQVLNLGDCLLRPAGAKSIATSLKQNCFSLSELNLGYNEIDKEGGLEIVDAIENKVHLQSLILDGNQFGSEGCQMIEDRMSEIEKFDALGTFSEDEGEDDDEEEEDEEDEDYDEEQVEEEDEATESEEDDLKMKDKKSNQKSFQSPLTKTITPEDFLAQPTPEGLISLHKSNQDFKSLIPEESTVKDYLKLFTVVSLPVGPDNSEAKEAACKYGDDILKMAIESAADISEFNNYLLVQIGLIKGEDKELRKDLDITGILIVLEHAIRQSYFPISTRDLLQFFLSRPFLYAKASDKAKHTLMRTLYQI